MNPMMERVPIRWNGHCFREKHRLNSKLSSQDPDWQTGSALSYHPSPAHSNHIHQLLGQPPNPHHYQLTRQIITTPNKSGSNSKSMNNDSSKKQSFAIQSYSAAVRRAADAPQVPSIWSSSEFFCDIDFNQRSRAHLRGWQVWAVQVVIGATSLRRRTTRPSRFVKRQPLLPPALASTSTIPRSIVSLFLSTSIVNFQPSPDPRYPCQNR